MTANAAAPSTRGRKRRFTDRRLEVLRTAARTFSAKGYRQATLEDIAGELNMTRPALYHYAASKVELLWDCGEVALESLLEVMAEAEAQATGLEQLRVYFQGYLAVACDDFGRCLVLTDPREMSDEHRAWQHEHHQKRNRRIEAMLQGGIDDGTIAPCDVVEARRILFATFNAAQNWVRAKDKRGLKAAAAGIFDLFVQGLAPRA